MAGTRAGGLKAAAKNKANNPNFYKEIGKKGGQNGRTGGFYNDPERAKACGAKGGKSHRGRGPALRDAKGRAIKKDGTPYAKKVRRKIPVKVVEEPAPEPGFLARLLKRWK